MYRLPPLDSFFKPPCALCLRSALPFTCRWRLRPRLRVLLCTLFTRPSEGKLVTWADASNCAITRLVCQRLELSLSSSPLRCIPLFSPRCNYRCSSPTSAFSPTAGIYIPPTCSLPAGRPSLDLWRPLITQPALLTTPRQPTNPVSAPPSLLLIPLPNPGLGSGAAERNPIRPSLHLSH